MAHGHGPSPLSFYAKLKPGNGTALSDLLCNTFATACIPVRLELLNLNLEQLWTNFGPTLDQIWTNFGQTADQLCTNFGPTLEHL